MIVQKFLDPDTAAIVEERKAFEVEQAKKMNSGKSSGSAKASLSTDAASKGESPK
mgnify:CR=1 FL=1